MQQADIGSYQLVGYGSYSLDESTEVSFQLDAGMNSTEGVRQLPSFSLVAQSDYDSTSTHVGVGLSRTYILGDKTSIAPSLRADYTHISTDGYTETGAGAMNLVVADDTTNAFIVSVDGS